MDSYDAMMCKIYIGIVQKKPTHLLQPATFSFFDFQKVNIFRLDFHNHGEAFLCEDLEALLSPGKLNVGDLAEFRKFSKMSSLFMFFLPFLIVHDIHES